MKRGSGPILAAVVAVFGVAFALLRGSSGFLAVEAEAPVLRPLAERNGLDLALVLALREQARELPPAAFADRVDAFAALRARLGDPLAAVAVAGDDALARQVLAEHEDDREAAWHAFHLDPRAIPGLRLLQMRDRFAERAAARGGGPPEHR